MQYFPTHFTKMNSMLHLLLLLVCMASLKHAYSQRVMIEMPNGMVDEREGSGPEVCEEDSCQSSLYWCNPKTGRCECKAGLYVSEGTCKSAKLFGSKLYLSSLPAPFHDDHPREGPEKDDVEAFINDIFKESTGYIQVHVDESDDGLLWKYTLIYESTSPTNENDLKLIFTVYGSDKCKDAATPTSSCKIQLGSTEYLLNVAESIEAVGDSDDVVCGGLEGFCDDVTSNCTSDVGRTSCSCKVGFVKVPGNERACAKKICSSNTDCNSPFGWCNPDESNGVGRCDCMFGFEGQNCYSPWLFVCIISFGVVLILFVTLMVVSCRKSSKQKKKTKHDQQYSGTGVIPNMYTKPMRAKYDYKDEDGYPTQYTTTRA